MAQSQLNQRYSLYFQRVNLLYQRPEIKASLEIILSVFTVTMLILFAIRPTITNIFSLQKKIADQEVLLKKTDNKIGQLITAQKQISENSQYIEQLSEVVPASFDYFSFTKRMVIVAKDNNVAVDTISLPGNIMAGKGNALDIPKEKAKNYSLPDKDGLLLVSAKFSVTGDQTGVFGFLTELENMDRVTLIENIDISKTQKSASDNRQALTVTGSVNFYSYEQKQ